MPSKSETDVSTLRCEDAFMPVSKTSLRKTGGSLTLTVPAEIAKELSLEERQNVKLSVRAGKIIMEPIPMARGKMTLAERLAMCDTKIQYSEDLQAWVDIPSVGDEPSL
jgi:antitoxin component of MazEF toxin-antitoxin module